MQPTHGNVQAKLLLTQLRRYLRNDKRMFSELTSSEFGSRVASMIPPSERWHSDQNFRRCVPARPVRGTTCEPR
eukprot:1117715-Pyramimonas_sp.AAC.1